MTTTKKTNYAEETIRDTQHARLDEVYSKRQSALADREIESVEETSGKAKAKKVTLTGDTIDTNGEVLLDREGWLALAKHASRRAQSVA